MEGSESNIRGYRYWFWVYKCSKKPNLIYGTICSNIINIMNNHHNIFIYTKIEQSNSRRGNVCEGVGLRAAQISVHFRKIKNQQRLSGTNFYSIYSTKGHGCTFFSPGHYYASPPLSTLECTSMHTFKRWDIKVESGSLKLNQSTWIPSKCSQSLDTLSEFWIHFQRETGYNSWVF